MLSQISPFLGRLKMTGNKLRQLSEQLDFLTTLEQDSLDECFQEYGSLMLFLEKIAAKEGNPEVCASIEVIRNVLAESRDKILADYESDLAHLATQKQIVTQALSVKDSDKLAKIEEIIIEEVGDLDDNVEFKKRVGEANAIMRQEFLEMINEIREIVEEGAVDELVAFFEASTLDKDEEDCEEDANDSDLSEKDESEEQDSCELDPNCDDEDNSEFTCPAESGEGKDCTCSETFDLSANEDIMNFLKQYSEPFFVDKTDEKKNC